MQSDPIVRRIPVNTVPFGENIARNGQSLSSPLYGNFTQTLLYLMLRPFVYNHNLTAKLTFFVRFSSKCGIVRRRSLRDETTRSGKQISRPRKTSRSAGEQSRHP